MLSKSVRLVAGQRVRLPSGLSPLVSVLVGHCVPLLVGHCVRLVSLLFPFVSLLASLLVGHCVRLVSLHSFFVSGLVSLPVGHCVRFVSLLLAFVSLLVSLLVDHCVRLVSLLLSFVSFLFPSCWSLCTPRPFCLPLSPVLSPFLLVIVSALSPFCLPLSLVLSPFLLDTVSVLSPFCFLLSPFLFPLLSPFLVIASALSSFFPLHVPPLSPSRLQPFTFVSQLLCPAILYICLPALGCVSLATLYICLAVSTFVSQLWTAVSASALQSLILHLSPSSDCCVRLCLAILYMCPRKPLHLSPSSRLLYPPLPCNPLFVIQLWAACRLQSFTFVSLCLHLSPSSGVLWPPLPCNSLSPSSGRRKLITYRGSFI